LGHGMDEVVRRAQDEGDGGQDHRASGIK
jgi:hypothetical protein